MKECSFYTKPESKIFHRRKSDDEKHNNRERLNRQRKKEERDRSSKKRIMCIKCQENRALTNLSGWSKQLCTKCAKENGCSFPENKILNKREVKPRMQDEYIQLHMQYRIVKRDKAQCKAEKKQWKSQALRKKRECEKLIAQVSKLKKSNRKHKLKRLVKAGHKKKSNANPNVMAEMTVKNEETPLKKCKAEQNTKKDFDEDIGAK